MSRLLTLLLGLAVAATSCAAGGGGPATSDTPDRGLAGRPTPLGAVTGPIPPPVATSSRPRTPTPSAGGGDGGASDASPSARASSTSAAGPARSAPYRGFADLADSVNDAGLGAPAYGDLLSVALADNGTNIRVTVIVAGDLPNRAAAGETLGIGVDLYRPGTGRESDYQLFADGEPDGWFAYLQTPRGFVRYPGTFALGGQRLVFTIPWRAVGNLTTGRFTSFIDWSRRSSGITGNDASNDYAPTLGTRDYAR